MLSGRGADLTGSSSFLQSPCFLTASIRLLVTILRRAAERITHGQGARVEMTTVKSKRMH